MSRATARDWVDGLSKVVRRSAIVVVHQQQLSHYGEIPGTALVCHQMAFTIGDIYPAE